MEFTARQIAGLIGGRVEGNADAAVHTFAKIEEGQPGAISFLSNPKYTHFIYDTQSTIVLVDEALQLEHEVTPTLIRVPNAYEAVAKLMQAYEAMKPRKQGIDPKAAVSPTAQLADDVYVGAFAVIGEGVKVGSGTQIYPHAVIGDHVTVGNDCLVYPNVTVYEGCRIGNRVTLHAGSVIGADGFGFAPNNENYTKIPQIGIVVIEDDVEIGANTCVDRSTMGQTVIHRGVKLDNLVQVAHNCEVGENTVMSAQVGLAGSTKIGKWCMVGGQAGFAGHITVADKTFVGAQCGVIGSTKGNEQLIGSPAMEPRQFFKSMAVFRRLPEMYRDLNDLKRKAGKDAE